MKRQYQEPVVEIIYFESNTSIAARLSDSKAEPMADIISGFEGDIPSFGDVMD